MRIKEQETHLNLLVHDNDNNNSELKNLYRPLSVESPVVIISIALWKVKKVCILPYIVLICVLNDAHNKQRLLHHRTLQL